MNDPRIDELLAVLTQAAVGDGSARVAVPADAPSDDTWATLGRLVNLVLADLSRADETARDAARIAAIEARGDLLDLLALELRAPRASLAGLRGPVRDHLEDLAEALEGLGELVGLESGRIVLAERPLALRALLAERAVAQAVAVDVALEPSVPASVLGDARQLGRALDAVLAVAVAGGGEVTLRAAAPADQDWHLLRIAVTDTGPGAPPALLDRMARPYAGRPLAEASDDHELGLGLALAARIASALGGRLDVRSEPGAGTTSVLLAPLRAAPPATGAQTG